MDKFKIIPTDEKILSKLLMEFDKECAVNFKKCYLTEIVVVPEVRRWTIFLRTEESLGEKLLRDVEIFSLKGIDSSAERFEACTSFDM